jgi:undecaprenyl-diphosphatase
VFSGLSHAIGAWRYVWLIAVALATVMTLFAFFDTYPPGDVTISRAVQSIDLPGVQTASDLLYLLGSSPLFQLMAFTAAGSALWRGHRLTASLFLVAAICRGLAGVIKGIVERERPSPFVVDVSEQAAGFSFPSGHVLGTILVWGFLCYAAEELIPDRRWRFLTQGVCIAMIALMGLQRVYVGAHWPTDVLAAYLWGAVVLLPLVAVHRISTARLEAPAV